MREPNRAYWMKMAIEKPADIEAVCRLLGPLKDDGMKIESCHILCEKETDREKSLKVVATLPTGDRYKYVRTLGGRNFSVSRVRLNAGEA